VPEWTPRIRKVSTGDGESLQFAKSLLRVRRFDEAQQEAQRYLASVGTSAAAQVTLGLAHLGQRRVDAALACFNEAIANDPLQAEPLVAAGYAHLQNKDVTQAERCFEEALRLDADSQGAKIGIAQALNMRGRTDEARRYLEELLAGNPEQTAARVLLVRLHDKAGDVDATVEEIDALLERHPGQSGVANLLSIMFQHRDRLKYDESIRLLEAATRFDPRSAAAWTWLGRARLMAGHPLEAERAFREAIKRRRSPGAALAGLAEALAGQGRLADARDVFGIVPRRGRLAALIERGYGDICFAEQNYEAAWRHFHAALLLFPSGGAIIAALEKEMPADQATAETLARHVRNALNRVMGLAKKRRSERDWLALGRRLAHVAWAASRGRDERAVAAGPPLPPASRAGPSLRISTLRTDP